MKAHSFHFSSPWLKTSLLKDSISLSNLGSFCQQQHLLSITQTSFICIAVKTCFMCKDGHGCTRMSKPGEKYFQHSVQVVALSTHLNPVERKERPMHLNARAVAIWHTLSQSQMTWLLDLHFWEDAGWGEIFVSCIHQILNRFIHFALILLRHKLTTSLKFW